MHKNNNSIAIIHSCIHEKRLYTPLSPFVQERGCAAEWGAALSP